VNIIIFGPPGAGKGTQADKISSYLNLHKISTGDLLRNEVKNNTDLGNKIKPIIENGKLVSNEIINNLITKILSKKAFYNRLIFDGYPRNLNQAKDLDFLIKKHEQKISHVLSLNVDKDTVVKRVLGRQVCTNCGKIFNEYFSPPNSNEHNCESKFLEKRSDDSEKIIVNRYETYEKETLPILNFYKKQNLLHEFNGNSEINLIYKEIMTVLGILETWLYKLSLYK